MKKIKLNLLKFSSFVLLVFLIQTGYSINNNNLNFTGETPSTIACNDTVNIAMGSDCITTITPDQLLEGNYPDFGIFQVNVIDQYGSSIGNTVNSDHVGLVLVAEALDTTTGNKCWTHIKMSDKLGPPLVCDTIFTTCYKYPIPGEYAPHNYRFAYNLQKNIPDGDTLIIPLVIGKIPGALIIDVDVQLNIKHENDIDLAAYLVSAENDTVELFTQLTCGNSDFEVKFDDNAEQTASDLTNGCSPNICCPDEPAIKGTYQVTGKLSDFNGENPTGTWYLVVIDKNQGNLGVVEYASILIKQNGGFINFPIPLTSSTPIEIGEKKYRVISGFDPCGETILTYYDEFVELDCSTEYTGYILRTWVAEDESGNVSVCTQYIYIIRTGISFLVFPPNYDNIDQPALSCDPFNPDFYPEPSTTGAPGYPGDELCSMVTVRHEDQVIDICSGTFKIIRHWSITEMCSSEVIEHNQVITVMDATGPVLSKLPDDRIPSDDLECSRDIYLQFPEILSDCSDFELITKEVGYQVLDKFGNPETVHLLTYNLEKLTDNTFVLRGAPVGTYKFTYTAIDDCGNISTSTNYIEVYDNAPPVAVCDHHTQVTLGTDGTAKTEAFVYDDGSHDNCSDITYKVSRMNPVCDTEDINFRDTINFCCEDVNTTQMVTLQVTDKGGRTNTCMVEVNIVDKIGPVIKCPSNVEIDCDADYLDLTLTGSATAEDNCEIDTLYYLDNIDINQCNVGLIKRTWYTNDNHGHYNSCSQYIYIQNFNPFQGYDDIIWPTDKEYDDCVENFDTSITGSVKFKNEDLCSMVAARYEDEVFNVVAGSCLKILRHWEVIDWCNYDEKYPENSTWRYTQIIILDNKVAPIFDEECSTKNFCTYGPCSGEIDYTKTASDDCTDTEDLNWIYRIDLDNDGDWDLGPYYTNHLKGIFQNGTHRVAWSVEDGCGNITSCEEIFIVEDCKKPTPLCITQLTTVTMNVETGMVSICAEDFNLGNNCDNCPTGSYDNCTPNGDLTYSFSTDVSDSCRTYTCSDIPNGEQVFITLDMWVTDEAGNQDYCTIYLDLQDNEADACLDSLAGSLVYGFIYDPVNKPLKNIEVKIETNEGVELYDYTNNNGRYLFDNLSVDKNYNLSADLQTSYLMGVTTLDLVHIQKHLLGINPFEKPYKYIAADVNKSRTVSASDILAIRKVILGENDNFGQSTKSWSFVKDGNDIRENNNILATWKEYMTIEENMFGHNLNWVGIKMGDVNNSSSSFINNGAIEDRNSGNTILVTDEKSFSKDEIFKVNYSFTDLDEIIGGQFTLNFDNKTLSYLGLEINKNLMSTSDFGLSQTTNGKITTSWVKPINAELNSNNLFTVIFKAKNKGVLSENISLSNDITSIEAYNNSYEALDIKLQFRNNTIESSEYVLYQNIPNPFNHTTNVLFDLPRDQEASIKFFDVTGRIMKVITRDFKKGRNSIEVSFDELVSGVIYYKLETGEFTITKKMINLK